MLVIAAALAAQAAAAEPAATGPVIDGAGETVFAWSRDRCETWDIPDAPARAWRDGVSIRLAAGSERTRAAEGSSLDAMRRDCAVLHEGAGRDDPSAFDDRSWIASVWAHGDGRVEALTHEEFHGHLRPHLCPAAEYMACWRNAVAALISEDGGRRFRRTGAVATPAGSRGGRVGGRVGYFNPSNTVRSGDHLFVFVYAEGVAGQRRGACLLRRPLEGGAGDWRAWDGRGFSVRLDGRGGGCAPVAGPPGVVSSVVRHSSTGLWLAVSPGSHGGRTGIWTSVSTDLTRWSQPRLLLEVPLLWRRDCGVETAYAYPSLIDPDSPSPSFDAVDDRFWLYLTRLQLGKGCRVGPERDLVRFPVSWPGPSTPRSP